MLTSDIQVIVSEFLCLNSMKIQDCDVDGTATM
jgi:hypothetical protein